MEFSWPLTLTVIFLNLAVIVINFLLQQLDLAGGLIATRWSIIPGTNQKFLHWQDFWVQKIGDTIFLNGMFISFWHLLIFTSAITFINSFLFVIVLSADVHFFEKMCTSKNHKPDWGFPTEGKESSGGFFHMVYHGFGIAVFLWCLWHIFGTHLLSGPLEFIFWVGIVGYAICFVVDIVVGNFDKLKLIESKAE